MNTQSAAVELDSRMMLRASGFMISINLGVGSRAQYNLGQESDPELSEVMMILKVESGVRTIVRWSAGCWPGKKFAFWSPGRRRRAVTLIVRTPVSALLWGMLS